MKKKTGQAETPTGARAHLITGIVAATLCRILLNTARRFAYPYAPALSRAFNVPLPAITSLIAVNQATSVIGLVFGPIADRFGYRRMMTTGMVMLVAGMLAVGILPQYTTFFMGLILAGLGKTIFDPAVQAFTGENISFARRGLAIGILEFSWAGSTLLGIPLIGLLIDRYGWRSPFFVLAAAGLAALLVLNAAMSKSTGEGVPGRQPVGMWRSWRILVRHRPALGAIGYGFFVSAANDNLFVIYGAWLESSFQIGIVALGLGTGLIGVAELCGELGTALLADRIGLKKSVLMGLVLTLVGYLALPFTESRLALAWCGLFFLFLAFEFTIVCSLSLATELMPDLRATMMAMLLAAAGLGRVVGALSGGFMWMAGGIQATAFASAALTAAGLVSMGWGIRHWNPAPG